MSIGTVLYLIIIRPLELLFEVVFSVANAKLNSIGLTIIVLSVVINLLVLPLYHRADFVQKKENDKAKKLKKWESHIKNSFSGDERFMMLQTYYRQNDYKPYESLGNIIPLFLEIPFFIAAYRFLSGLIILQGVSFGPIVDLGKPDAILKIYGKSINVLPITMTLINLLSSYIYSKGSSIKNKIQMYGIALIFLAFLYHSPAGLCFYWTLNNVFSLIKNIIYSVLEKNNKKTKKIINTRNICSNEHVLIRVYLCASVFLVALLGLYIPSLVIDSSVEEFYNISFTNPTNPIIYIFTNFFTFFGVIVLWFGVVYYLSSERIKYVLSFVLVSLSIVSILNFSLLEDDNRLSKFFIFESTPNYSKIYLFQSFIILVAVFILISLLIIKRPQIIVYPLLFGGLALLFISGKKLLDVNNQFQQKKVMLNNYSDEPEICLSKNGQNVIVIMMDRMISYYIPYIINEKPELKDKLAGFTYYPNCVSLGASTNSGSPGLYGGYEYTPEEMNKRDSELLRDKQNEALKIMPVLFNNNNFDVTVSDPTYANYDWIPDLSIYDEYPEIKKFISMGRLNDEDFTYIVEYKIKRNMFFYSLYKVSPVFLRDFIYEGGNYNEPYYLMGIGYQILVNEHVAYGISEELYNSYCVLNKLDKLTRIDSNVDNSFFMMSNDLTHSPSVLTHPEYMPSDYVNNTEYDLMYPSRQDENGNTVDFFTEEIGVMNGERMANYDVNMAAIIKLCEWFDYLRKEGVYDNTRIIIVSDHSTDQFFDKNYRYNISFPDGKSYLFDLYRFQSTLLVKDFNSKEFIIDNQFMTNADVPSIAMKDIISNPINPFTGKVINSDRKNKEQLQLQATNSWSTETNNGYKFVPEHWFTVRDNIFDKNNWSYLGYY